MTRRRSRPAGGRRSRSSPRSSCRASRPADDAAGRRSPRCGSSRSASSRIRVADAVHDRDLALVVQRLDAAHRSVEPELRRQRERGVRRARELRPQCRSRASCSGITVCSPSAPPASWTITRTRSFITPSRFAAYTARANTSGTAAYPAASPAAPAPKTRPFFRKSRRESREDRWRPLRVPHFSWNSGDASTANQRDLSSRATLNSPCPARVTLSRCRSCARTLTERCASSRARRDEVRSLQHRVR